MGNLHGNSFSNVNEGTALHNMVYGMTNWRDRKELVWSRQNGGGKFASLPNEIRLFVSLVTLDLSGNDGLTTIPDEISKLQNLKELNLAGTAITTVPPSIGDCKSLTSLNLQSCSSLAGLPHTIGNLQSL